MILKEYNIEIENMFICQLHPLLNNYKLTEFKNLSPYILKILTYLKETNYKLKQKEREEKFELDFSVFFKNIF